MSRPDQNLPTDAELTEPWQALALSIALREAGLISTAEWSETLGAEIEKARAAGDPADGTTYYGHVVAALERLVHKEGAVAGGPSRHPRAGLGGCLSADTPRAAGTLGCIGELTRGPRDPSSARHKYQGGDCTALH